MQRWLAGWVGMRACVPNEPKWVACSLDANSDRYTAYRPRLPPTAGREVHPARVLPIWPSKRDGRGWQERSGSETDVPALAVIPPRPRKKQAGRAGPRQPWLSGVPYGPTYYGT